MKRRPCLIETCESCSLRAKAILCDLPAEDLAAFQKIKRFLLYDSHQVVFYEGHACLDLYLLCAGTVKLTRTSVRGQRQILGIVDSGELIEKHAFRDGAIHEATCETLERSSICLIEKEPYLALLRHNSDLALKLIELLGKELGRNVDRLEQYMFKTARERLAALLLELGHRFGRTAADGVLVRLILKREEIAEMAGVALETVIRLLRAFREEGLVRIEGRTITLLNPDRLARIARLF